MTHILLRLPTKTREEFISVNKRFTPFQPVLSLWSVIKHIFKTIPQNRF